MTDSYYMDRRSISYPVLHRAVAIPDQLISKFFKLNEARGMVSWFLLDGKVGNLVQMEHVRRAIFVRQRTAG